MSDAATEELIRSLLDSKKLSDEATEDLTEFLNDIKEGGLQKDDAAYVRSLADRLGVGGSGDGAKGRSKSAAAKPDSAPKSDAVDWQERAVIAEAKIEDLQEEIDGLNEDIRNIKEGKADAAPEADAPEVDIEELRELLGRLYDDENETLQDISNEDAAAILKEMAQKLG